MSNEYTLGEITMNDGESGRRLWMLLDGNVYDVTDYQSIHPGGKDVFIDPIGEDRKDEFDSIGHSNAAHEEMKKFIIGKLKKEEIKTTVDVSAENVPAESTSRCSIY